MKKLTKNDIEFYIEAKMNEINFRYKIREKRLKIIIKILKID